jgi:hypothetical protein
MYVSKIHKYQDDRTIRGVRCSQRGGGCLSCSAIVTYLGWRRLVDMLEYKFNSEADSYTYLLLSYFHVYSRSEKLLTAVINTITVAILIIWTHASPVSMWESREHLQGRLRGASH